MNLPRTLIRIGWVLATLLIMIGLFHSLPVTERIIGSHGEGLETSVMISPYLIVGLVLFLILLFMDRNPFRDDNASQR